MGWASGGDVFEPVVNELIDWHADSYVVYRVTKRLIETLTERGWDTVEESIGIYTHEEVLRAANELGYYAHHQIPEDGGLSEAKILCSGCGRQVRYLRDEEGDLHSVYHSKTVEEGHNELCAYSNKDPRGY